MRIDLWKTSTDLRAAEIAECVGCLSDSERARADSFHFERDRNRFIASRSFVRAALAPYLGIEPNDVSFLESTGRKPVIENVPAERAVEFNASRSADTAVCAIAVGPRPIGIDIEEVRTLGDLADVADRVFAPHERAYWSTVEVDRRPEAFFRLWTRKEALGKAMGRGISDGPETLEVPVEPLDAGRSSVIRRTDGGSRWLLGDVPMAGTMAGAVVVGLGEGACGAESSYEDTVYQANEQVESESDEYPVMRVPAGMEVTVRRLMAPDRGRSSRM